MFNKVPLVIIDLDKKKYRKNGKKNSCIVKIHPYVKLLNQDIQDELKYHLNKAIDIIRDNLNTDKL